MFSNAVLNIFNNPKNTGRISKPDGIADLFNMEGTAHVEFSLRIADGIIQNCQFRAQANPYFVATCSTITNLVKGKTLSNIFLDPYTIKKDLGDESDYDIDFCIDCLRLAVEDYKEKLEKENKTSNKPKNAHAENDVNEEDLEEMEVEITEETVEETNKRNTIEEIAEKLNKKDNNDEDDDFSEFFDDEDFLL